MPPTYCNSKQNGVIFIAKLVVAEKPSVAMSYAKVLGATSRQDGYLEGNGYLVSWCVGHLVELAPPNVYDAKYVKWSIADLPILPEKWQYLVSASTKKQFGILQKLMHRPDVESVICATDSGREGELIFRLVYQQAGCKKPFSRLWLSSMEESAIREGFAHLKPSTEYDALYNAALCRERADWIHNHIVYNSTALDGTRKFRDFLLSGLAVQRLSDLICLEHQLSVIEIKPYRERQKRTLYPPKESNRDRLCGVIDNILAEKPKDYEDFLQKLGQQGYEVKRGKYTSVKGARQKRFIRFRTLGAGYSEEELKSVISGEAEHHPRQKQNRIVPEQKFQMLVDIQAKLADRKSMGYARWAKRYNLKEMSKTLVFLQEHKIGSVEEMQERVDAATARYHELGDSIKAAETRMAEIAVLRTHIVNYARTRPIHDAYRKAGYSKKFLGAHREEITLHKAAKTAFDEAGLKKLPKAKDLSIEYAELLKKKKEAYPDYRKARDEMQELMKAQKNVEMFFAEEKSTTEKGQAR